MSDEKHIIHVKPWNSSATLSHLFSQGRVSCETLFQDPDFRRLTREKISQINVDFVDYIKEDNYDPSEIEVVYAVIDKEFNEIPFFSKLNMMQTVKYLKNLRYNVTKLKIVKETEC